MQHFNKLEAFGSDFFSPLLRNYIWADFGSCYPRLFGIQGPVLGAIGEKQRMWYVADMMSWQRTGAALQRKIKERPKFFLELVRRTNAEGERFVTWCARTCNPAVLAEASAQELIATLQEFRIRQRDMYALGCAMPMLDFGESTFLESGLQRVLQDNCRSPRQRASAYQVFTYPAYRSFAGDQEIALLKLVSRYYGKSRWRHDVMRQNLQQLRAIWPKFERDLQTHARKYGWVYYVYAGPAYTAENFLEFVRDFLRKKVSPSVALGRMEKREKEMIRKKKSLIRSMGLRGLDKLVAEFAGVMVWAKPRRKDYQSHAYYYFENWQREVGKRLFLSLDQVRALPPQELRAALSGKRKDWPGVAWRYAAYHVCYSTKAGVRVLGGEAARRFAKQHIKEESAATKAPRGPLRGTVAFPGVVKGSVRIVNNVDQMSAMKQGEILVSIATSPNIVGAMKKAAAIVTDEGGLTCHASIVSRELGIPCVVGTIFGSSVLRDGDRVRVDARRGIVEKL